MSITRIFLDWSSPCLEGVAKFLISRFPAAHGLIDMQQAVLVLPGKRAKRQLLEILVKISEHNGAFLLPPEHITVGALPELMYQPSRPIADEPTRILAWLSALESTPKSSLRQFLPDGGPTNKPTALLALSREFEECWQNLLGSGFFPEQALEVLKSRAQFSDEERWQTFGELGAYYLSLLEANGRSDAGAERLLALNDKKVSLDKTIFLIGVVELRPIVKKMLRACAVDVISLIHAPEKEQASFDDFGCVLAASWLKRGIEIAPPLIHFSNTPEEQAAAIKDLLIPELQRGALCTVGSLDSEVVPFLAQHFHTQDLRLQSASGTPFLFSAPGKLISLLLRYLSGGSDFRDFAAAVRHPDILRVISETLNESPASILTKLDDFYSRSVVSSVSSIKTIDKSKTVVPILQAFSSLFASFLEHPKTLTEWMDELVQLLEKVYPEEYLSHEGTSDASPSISQSLDVLLPAIESLSSSPMANASQWQAVEALQILLSLSENQMIPPSAYPPALDLLGWLELHLDPSPRLFISGANEGYLPQSLTSHFFLPDSTRNLLDIPDNALRFARDKYLLTSIIKSREVVHFFASRNSLKGDPLMPSRLLLADKPEISANRALQFYKPEEDDTPGTSSSSSLSLVDTIRTKPKQTIKTTDSPQYLSTTAFRDYLSCPFGYYLRHILKLSTIDDSAEELDALLFGNLAHDVLKAFSELEFSPIFFDSENLYSELSLLLDKTAKQFGSHPAPPVAIQVEQLRLRLRSFAAWQSSWFEQGWRIREAEKTIPEEYCSIVLNNGQKVIIKAKIDRLDFNENSGQWMIIDYKTGENPLKLGNIYQASTGRWKDLQLPLYQILLNRTGIKGAISSGYLNLSREKTSLSLGADELTQELLTSAFECVLETAEKITSGEFWPPSPEKQYAGELETLRIRAWEHFSRQPSEERGAL